MAITEALGIDIGAVIIAKARSASDTSFSREDYLEAPAVPQAFQVIRRLVDERFGARVSLVSKCGPRVQAETLRWLKHHAFYEKTGVKPRHVHFCDQRSDKARICRELAVTHFVDDRLDVLQSLRQNDIAVLSIRPALINQHSEVEIDSGSEVLARDRSGSTGHEVLRGSHLITTLHWAWSIMLPPGRSVHPPGVVYDAPLYMIRRRNHFAFFAQSTV